uniref:Uncharacterized protein n=1 Tax=Bos indicus x Bos taurus TaxID=30522 RepID=A0A4W2HQS4_BOBOX
MDWGKTLSSEQPRAADLASLPLISRLSRVSRARACLSGWVVPGSGSWDLGETPGVGSASGPGLRGQGMQTPMGSAPAFSLRIDLSPKPLPGGLWPPVKAPSLGTRSRA